MIAFWQSGILHPICLSRVENSKPFMSGIKLSVIVGMLLSFAATYLASLGNIISDRNQHRKLPVVQTNAYGMAYGSLCMVLVVMVSGAPITIDLTAPYLTWPCSAQ
jgi:hypothetical protein